jgi:hypothetical protein
VKRADGSRNDFNIQRQMDKPHHASRHCDVAVAFKKMVYTIYISGYT